MQIKKPFPYHKKEMAYDMLIKINLMTELHRVA